MKTAIESAFTTKSETVSKPDSLAITETGRAGCGFVTGYEVAEIATGFRLAWFGVQNPYSGFRKQSRAIALERARRFANR